MTNRIQEIEMASQNVNPLDFAAAVKGTRPVIFITGGNTSLNMAGSIDAPLPLNDEGHFPALPAAISKDRNAKGKAIPATTAFPEPQQKRRHPVFERLNFAKRSAELDVRGKEEIDISGIEFNKNACRNASFPPNRVRRARNQIMKRFAGYRQNRGITHAPPVPATNMFSPLAHMRDETFGDCAFQRPTRANRPRYQSFNPRRPRAKGQANMFQAPFPRRKGKKNLIWKREDNMLPKQNTPERPRQIESQDSASSSANCERKARVGFHSSMVINTVTESPRIRGQKKKDHQEKRHEIHECCVILRTNKDTAKAKEKDENSDASHEEQNDEEDI